MLFTEQVVVKDVIADWFSDEQYAVSHVISANPGWSRGKDDPNVSATRHFLRNILPQLRRVRPLIDTGVVVLIPEEQTFLEKEQAISGLQARLTSTLLGDIGALSRKFKPSDLAVDDARRGMFVFAPGEDDRELGIRRAFEQALLYFPRQYVHAESNQAIYAAPFPFETVICEDGLGRLLLPSDKVARCVLSSDLPIFRGLTPELLASVHGDDSFAEFRQELFTLYGQAPVGSGEPSLRAYIKDAESAQLAPILEKARRDADRGILSRIGLSLAGGAFGLTAGLVVGSIDGSMITAGIGAAGAAVDGVRAWRRDQGTLPVWTSLVRHGRTVQDEIRAVPQAGTFDGTWGIPDEPSLSVVVSPGILGTKRLPSFQDNPVVPQPSGYTGGVYRPCDCGSGLKYKFCCYGVPDVVRRWPR